MRIWKWPIQITDRQTVMMPAGAQVLTVQTQGGQPQLWALVDEMQDAPKTPRKFAVYGTGNSLPENPGRYITTFQQYGGDLVWHVFELHQSST